MKIISLLIIIVFINANGPYFLAQNYWKQVQSPTNHKLRNIFFVDSLYGSAAGDSGTVIRTTNGGNAWHLQNSNLSYPIWSIYFLNENNG